MGFRDRLVSRLGYELEPAYVPETENRGIANTAPAREAVGVTPTTALSLVPVSRATSVLETAIMQIPVNVYRGNDQLTTPLWLETPDIEISPYFAFLPSNTEHWIFNFLPLLSILYVEPSISF